MPTLKAKVRRKGEAATLSITMPVEIMTSLWHKLVESIMFADGLVEGIRASSAYQKERKKKR